MLVPIFVASLLLPFFKSLATEDDIVNTVYKVMIDVYFPSLKTTKPMDTTPDLFELLKNI